MLKKANIITELTKELEKDLKDIFGCDTAIVLTVTPCNTRASFTVMNIGRGEGMEIMKESLSRMEIAHGGKTGTRLQ